MRLTVPPIPNGSGESTLGDNGGGIDWVTVIGTGAALISAAAVIVGVIYWLATREGRTARAAREQQVSADVGEMVERVERLEKVVAGVVAEAEERRPVPVVLLQTGDGPVQSARVRRPAPPAVDIEQVVAFERRAALGTLPPAAKAFDVSEIPGADRLRSPILTAIAGAVEAVSGKYESVTEEDRKRFERTVETYVASLQAFIPRWLSFLETRRELTYFVAHVDNQGGAPATQASVRLHFPDPCMKGEALERPKHPSRPIFSRRLKPLAALAAGDSMRDRLLVETMRPPRFDPPNLTGPFYEDDSVKVRFSYPSIPHQDPFDTDPFLIRIPEAGTYNIGWSVHASNLLRPQEGSLELDVVWEEPDPTPVGTLDQLIELAD